MTEKSMEQMQWIMECVKKNLMFENLDPQSRTDVIKKMYQEKVPENYDLIKQHDLNATTFYVIEKGRFAIIVDGIKVATYTKGMCFGELALMHNGARAATVRAMEPSIVWVMQRNSFRRAVARAKKEMHSKRLEWIKKVLVFRGLKKHQLHNIDSAFEERVYS